jgi:hypothetical protein
VKGRFAEPSTAAIRKISYEAAPTERVPRDPKLSLLATDDLLRSWACPHHSTTKIS